jgi:hypothetical protein
MYASMLPGRDFEKLQYIHDQFMWTHRVDIWDKAS